jgi:hypothetical protein
MTRFFRHLTCSQLFALIALVGACLHAQGKDSKCKPRGLPILAMKRSGMERE